MEERTRWWGQSENQRGGEEKRSGKLVGAAEISMKSLQNAQALAEKLEHTGPAEKERVASVP